MPGPHKPDPFVAALPGFDLETEIRVRARTSAIELDEPAVRKVAAHARAVLSANAELHLTAITDPHTFVDRHLGESFEGAAMLEPGIEGLLLDLGSGNGYPGLVVSVVRAGLRPRLSEASDRKARFLRDLLRQILPEGEVLHAHVRSSRELESLPLLRLVVVRAAARWDRILPRLVSRLEPEGEVLLWAGSDVESVARRSAWRRLALEERRPLPGRERSWIWRFKPRL